MSSCYYSLADYYVIVDLRPTAVDKENEMRIKTRRRTSHFLPPSVLGSPLRFELPLMIIASTSASTGDNTRTNRPTDRNSEKNTAAGENQREENGKRQRLRGMEGGCREGASARRPEMMETRRRTRRRHQTEKIENDYIEREMKGERRRSRLAAGPERVRPN